MAKRAGNNKASAPPPLEVKLPAPGEDKPSWMRAGIFAAIGLAIGLSWPSLAGIRIGPEIPGSKKDEAPEPEVPASAVVAASASAAASAPAEPALAAQASNTQEVVVGGGTIVSCHKDGDRVKGSECGSIQLDEELAPKLEQLSTCPSALGLEGEMSLAFDIRFDKKEIRVLKGKKNELPSSTINGVLACAADYIEGLKPDTIPHQHERYRVEYTLTFYPPGKAPRTRGDTGEETDAAESTRGLGTVAWDTALVRSEPRVGKVIARLVRGTRVKLLGRRKDWYHVKVGSKDGWIYRGALGM